MRRLPVLKTLIQLLFILCMIAIFFGVPFLLIVIIMPTKVPFNFNGHSLNAGHFEVAFLVATILAGHCLFTYGIYLLKKTLALFEKKRFFDAGVITFFDQSGKAFIAAGMLWIVPPFFYRLLAENTLEISAEFSGISLPFFVLCFGFFLMVLSEIFLVAKTMKEENDLTV